MARHLFNGYRWMSPILRQGRYWFDMPRYAEEAKLSLAAVGAAEDERLEMAVQAVEVVWDIFDAGYAHCDLHADNLFWVGGRIVVIDFETMQAYPPGARLAFPLSYDITGRGMPPPFKMVSRPCYTAGPANLEDTLGVPAGIAVAGAAARRGC